MKDTAKHQGLRNQLVTLLKEKGIVDKSVLEAINKIPRHLFLNSSFADYAYQDKAFPIGAGQTISQPYTVAFQSQLLEVKKDHKILEIGTGSGYQTAVLAQLVAMVHSVERIKPLQDKARERLNSLGLNNVRFRHADGLGGWPGEGGYDGIIGTAAALGVPSTLTDLLAVGGCLILPVGAGQQQSLVRVRRTAEGLQQDVIEPAHFVPMLGGVIH